MTMNEIPSLVYRVVEVKNSSGDPIFALSIQRVTTVTKRRICLKSDQGDPEYYNHSEFQKLFFRYPKQAFLEKRTELMRRGDLEGMEKILRLGLEMVNWSSEWMSKCGRYIGSNLRW